MVPGAVGSRKGTCATARPCPPMAPHTRGRSAVSPHLPLHPSPPSPCVQHHIVGHPRQDDGLHPVGPGQLLDRLNIHHLRVSSSHQGSQRSVHTLRPAARLRHCPPPASSRGATKQAGGRRGFPASSPHGWASSVPRIATAQSTRYRMGGQARSTRYRMGGQARYRALQQPRAAAPHANRQSSST